jgi:hypothetical protein
MTNNQPSLSAHMLKTFALAGTAILLTGALYLIATRGEAILLDLARLTGCM